MRRHIVVKLLLIVLVGCGLYAATFVYRAHSALTTAEELLTHRLWEQAREHLASYLWLHPNDSRARMLMAEAIINDETLPAESAALDAVQHMARIPDDSALAADARLRQGRLYFLILRKPHRAEQLIRKAIDLGSDDLPAYRLLWTLLDVTGRTELTEDVFWRVYELSPEAEQPLRLREWYMRLFFPLTANEQLDRMMGILAPDESPSRTSESRRYLRFRESEPEAVVNHVAMAQWFQHERDPAFALQLLDAAARDSPDSNPGPFFLSVEIAARLDLGQFDEAEASFRRWPAEDRGYLYWKSLATISDDVRSDHTTALEAYDRALAIWPGPVEWRLHHRRSNCLARLKRPQESATARICTEEVKALLSPDVHDRLRTALGFLGDPKQLAEVAKFYRKLGRNREAECWDKYIRSLQES